MLCLTRTILINRNFKIMFSIHLFQTNFKKKKKLDENDRQVFVMFVYLNSFCAEK